MTFGIAYFKRGNTRRDKFLRALGPGAGMNVTFMNFNDPSFDLSTSKFVNTTGTNVQVGAGIVGSLFDNKLQFSYGWNLNVERRRSYVAVVWFHRDRQGAYEIYWQVMWASRLHGGQNRTTFVC
jgi:hypothetical protein